MSGVLANPACEGEKLFIQVMGKDHPEGHEIVIVNQRSGERLADFGEAETEDLPTPSSVLYQWCWQGLERVDAQLHIATEAGAPIKLPLLEWLYKNKRKPRYQDNIIQPVMPMALFEGTIRNERHALPLRPGYLYIYYGESLWREIEVSAKDEEGKLVFRDINAAENRNEQGQYQEDRRHAVGVPLDEVWLPHRQEERAIDGQLRIAFSEVQWSAARLNYLETDEQARLTRCHPVNLSGGNNVPSLSLLYSLEENSEQRLRLPFIEENVAFPHELTSDLDGSYLQNLSNQAAQELQMFGAGGEQAHAAADEEMAQSHQSGQARPPLYLQASARLDAISSSRGQAEGDENSSSIWQEPLGSTASCLSDLKERDIPGLVIQDTLFELRHAMRGVQSSLSCLQQIPTLAAEDDLYECATLVNQTILKRQNGSGEPNPLNRFADKADLSDAGELNRILRTAQREVARFQFDTYQQKLHSLLLSRPAVAVLADLFSLEGHDYFGAYALCVDLLEGLRENAERADSLHDSPPTALSNAQQLLVNILSDGSSYALHGMLFPSDESTPLSAPLSLPEEEQNLGDGSIQLKALSELSNLDPPTENDDVQLLETAFLASLASDDAEMVLSSELKRWAGVVDLLFGRLAEQVEVLFEQSAQQAIMLPVARLARVGFPELFGQVTATRGAVREDVIILGVKDNAGQLLNGLTTQERDATRQGAQAQARQSFESAVRDASGKTLTPSQARRLAATAEAIGQQHLTVLVTETDSKAAQLSRRARHQLNVSRATESLRLPYLIAAFELFNVRQELLSKNSSRQARSTVGLLSAIGDLTIASLKAAEFYGERHQRLHLVRARAISHHLPLGDALLRSQSALLAGVGERLKGTITVVNFAGVAAGAVSAALLAWDAWNRFQHGNVGAGIALSIASVSSLVVAGSALFKTSPLWLGLGPVGWIALGLSLAAVLIAIKLTDNDIEEWLRLGPFGTTSRYDWSDDPVDAFERLVSLYANIRIRVESIGAMTAEMVVADGEQRPAIGIINQSPPPTHAENLVTERAASALSGPVANTRVIVNSNLPGLAPGWEQIAHFRFEATVEKKHEFRKEGYFQWIEEDKELGGAVQPLFERSTTDGREYYLSTPATTTQPASWRRPERRTLHKLKVRVQWQRPSENQNSVELPRMLPAPKPTETANGNPLIPDFTSTNQAYWANETTHQDKESTSD